MKKNQISNVSSSRYHQKSLKQLKMAFRILLRIKAFGVKEFCLCPGGRNAPLTYLLSYLNLGKVYYGFEERSAAFFALGRIQSTQFPVAVVTTSGTAVGELLPATMEAYYLGLPLILLTADRPKSYRGSGAPQSVEQKGIFSNYVCKEFDLEEDSIFHLKKSELLKAPIHINVCFSEPLGDFSSKEVHREAKHFFKKSKSLLSSKNQKKLIIKKKESKKSIFPSQRKHSIENVRKRLKNFFKENKRPLILVGEVQEKYRVSLKKILNSLFLPLYLEPLSGLREDQKMLKSSLLSWEKIFETKIFNQNVDSIIRIGGVPVLRFWRDLENKSYPVLNMSHLPYKGLSHLSSHPLSLESFCFLIEKDLPSVKEIFRSHWDKRELKALFEKDREIRKKIDFLLEKFPFSEPSLVSFISFLMKDLSFIFLGNSLPIREWDLSSTREKMFSYSGQRGVNGIDGLVSNFLGSAKPRKENWCVLGDLSVLYDLNALWFLEFRPRVTFRWVVINNGGGKIFSRQFKNSNFFENRHNFSFSKWAEMFSVEYVQLSSKFQNLSKMRSFINLKLKKLKSSNLVIEVIPSERETAQFWKAFDKI